MLINPATLAGRIALCAALALLAISHPAAAYELVGTVVKVVDGDTVHVLRENILYKVRLGGIDAPETGQPFGRASHKHLASLVAGKAVSVETLKRDRYDRLIGKVRVQPPGCDDCGRTLDANLAQVRAGMAWWYEYYKDDQAPADRDLYAAAERRARQSEVGLWSEPHPVPPWDWRRGNRTATPPRNAGDAVCGQRRYCREMRSCAEAKHYLQNCGLSRLDGDGDGVPCESLCR